MKTINKQIIKDNDTIAGTDMNKDIYIYIDKYQDMRRSRHESKNSLRNSNLN